MLFDYRVAVLGPGHNYSQQATIHSEQPSTVTNHPRRATIHSKQPSTASNHPQQATIHSKQPSTARNHPRRATIHGEQPSSASSHQRGRSHPITVALSRLVKATQNPSRPSTPAVVDTSLEKGERLGAGCSR